jgi:tight adherence protein B
VTALFNELPEYWPLLIGAALFAVLIAESAYALFFDAQRYRENVNRRLQIQKKTINREDALQQIKRERGIRDDGEAGILSAILNLIAQSGVRIGPRKVGMLWVVSALVGPVVPIVLDRSGSEYLLGGFLAGAVLPLLVLKYLRARRIMRFSEQLPDAIDVIVRSLKAGHPVQTAIGLVAREMPDPVGSEFGMVTDELSFGLELEGALRNLAKRVGQDDLPLFVTSVSIQSGTGGNLAAILEGLTKLIRDRFKMRRKIKALSSEARFSANALTFMPVAIYFMVQVADPTFFDATKGQPETQMVFIGSICWMAIGMLIMRKLVNMKI